MTGEIKFKIPSLDFTYMDEEDLDEEGNPKTKEYDEDFQKETIRLFEKYPYIVAWGQISGSYGYYIRRQCEKAEQDDAPSNAIYYYKEGNRWATFEEIASENTKQMIKQIAVEPTILTHF